MMRRPFDRTARLALCATACLALSACVDTPVSLGHHEAPAPIGDGDGDGDGDMNMLDASMEPQGGTGGSSGTGGAGGLGGTGGMSASGSGGAGGEVPEPPPGPCDTGTFSAQLQCEVDEPFQPGAPPRTMSTATTLVVTRIDRGFAQITGDLAFEAWGLSFTARLDGAIDCMRGELHADIVDGVATMSSGPSLEFIGAIDSVEIDPFKGTIMGPWWHSADMPGSPICIGPWAATRD